MYLKCLSGTSQPDLFPKLLETVTYFGNVKLWEVISDFKLTYLEGFFVFLIFFPFSLYFKQNNQKYFI